MIHLIIALKTEALSLINTYKLKKIKNLPFTLYANSEINLIITQMGIENANKSMELYLKYQKIEKTDIFINIGICAAPSKYKISQILFIQSIKYHENVTYLTPFKHKEYKTTALESFDNPQSHVQNNCGDMEAYAIVTQAARYVESQHIYVIKIVSDHYQPHEISKVFVATMMRDKNNEIIDIIEELRCQQQL